MIIVRVNTDGYSTATIDNTNGYSDSCWYITIILIIIAIIIIIIITTTLTLIKFDQLLRDGFCKICNISLSEDQWLYASLPVRFNGLGIRRVSSLAIPAFLASAVGTRNLQDHILHTNLISPYCDLDRFHHLWHEPYGLVQSLTSPAKQQTWNKQIAERELLQLMERQTESYDMARFSASASKHSGDWLHVIPISLCGLRLHG